MRTIHWFAAAVLLTVSGSLIAQPPVLPPKREGGDRQFNVKTRTDFEFAGGAYIQGIVDKLGKNGVTLKSRNYFDPTKEDTREVFVVDLLANGKVSDYAIGSYTYRWSDLKQGDRVSVVVLHDSGDDKDYLYSICIERRPGATLPVSQDPKKDTRYHRDRLLNEIDSSVDVSEEDIAEAFPPKLHPETMAVMRSGGLPCEYVARLHDLREKLAAEKKNAELKAPPPEKK